MDIIFREIREFGESLILLDQHPSKISLYALGNTYTTICMNLKHKTDINAMGQCMLLDKEREILGSLDVGQAVIKLQGRIGRPFQIVIPEFVIEKGKVTDVQIKQHMESIVSAITEEEFRLPANTEQSKKNDLIENLKRAFLVDIRDYPESGIAERYRRLGLSVRQGQKMKDRALKDELIEEYTETMKTGRIKIIKLTKKGWNFLCKNK